MICLSYQNIEGKCIFVQISKEIDIVDSSFVLVEILNERSIKVHLLQITHTQAYVYKEALSDCKCDRQAIPESFSLSCLDNGFILKDAVAKRCMRYFAILGGISETSLETDRLMLSVKCYSTSAIGSYLKALKHC